MVIIYQIEHHIIWFKECSLSLIALEPQTIFPPKILLKRNKMSTSRQSQSFRSLEFMQNIFTKIKAHGHQDKPMQSALQNVVIIAVIGAVVGVCFVLGPFLKVSLSIFFNDLKQL